METSQEQITTNATQPVRLIATDLDGTLLRPDGSVSQRTTAALQRTRQAGMTVVLVSARPPRVLGQIAQAAGSGGLALCCNGALVYDLDQQSILQSTIIPPIQTQWLVETMRAALPELHFAVEDGLEVTCEPGYHASFPQHSEKWELRVADIASCYSNSAAIKLMARHPVCTPEELHERVISLVGAAYSVTYSGGPFLEIALASVNKASALAQLCAQLRIEAHEVIAFGDMPNDLSMLRWAGHSVAVANAHPIVLAAVNEVTRSNEEDGVALVLERLLNNQGILS
jgi:Cof subfamily protein (haloacid dehalogenase superfamily)